MPLHLCGSYKFWCPFSPSNMQVPGQNKTNSLTYWAIHGSTPTPFPLFETGPHCVALASLKLTMSTQLVNKLVAHPPACPVLGIHVSTTTSSFYPFLRQGLTI